MKLFVVLSVIVAATFPVACQEETSVITIVSTKEMLNAAVLLDGKKVGELQFMMLHGTWYQSWLQKKYGKGPMDDMVAINIGVSSGFTSGPHEVKITKFGYKPYVEKFDWPPASGEHRVFIYADAALDPVTLK